MMKKLASLLIVLTLLTSCAAAESSLLSKVYTQTVLNNVCLALDAAEISYEKDAEYDGCFLSFDMTTPCALGDLIYTGVYAYEDGVNIISSFSEPVPADLLADMAYLCNYFSCETYLGKFYIDLYDNSLNYEIFIPLDPRDIREFDQTLISEYTFLSASMLEYHQDYFLEVLRGEAAANVIAMWIADME